MHIPDGFLSSPAILITGAASLAGFGHAMRRLRGVAGGRAPVMMGMMAAFVFAAQMVNFPVFPGVSGHLLGGVLSAVMLGPWGGMAVIGAVLLVQALLFADGGVTALGANFFNMGVLGAGLGYVVYRRIRMLAGGGPRGTLIGAVIAAWLSVILAAAACAVEITASHRSPLFLPVLGWMTLVHAAIGVGEALITGVVVQSILRVRPDLVPDPEAGPTVFGTRWGHPVLAGLAVAVATAVFLGPLASEWPDGFEYVGEKTGIAPEAGTEPIVNISPMPDYQLWLPGLRSLALATALAGAVGTLAVFAVATVLARALDRKLGLNASGVVASQVVGEAGQNGG